MSYNSELQHNNEELQEILDMADELPEAVSTEPQTLTEAQKTQARDNIAAVGKNNITVGLHTDGLLYVFVDGEPVGNGVALPSGAGGDVVGNVDSQNNIIVTGNLPDGTYNVKYELEDGSTIDVGDLVIDRTVYYSVTNKLTNCTNGNSATRVIEGESYSATITAYDGYELSSVVVTMGGANVSVTNGVINIANVTGNIVITAVAEVSGPINVLPLAINADGTPFVGTNGEKGYKTGVRISGSSGGETAQTGCMATGFIAVKYGERAVVENITENSNANYNVVCFYDENFARLVNTTLGGSLIEKPSAGVYEISPMDFTEYSKIRYVRFSCATISENTVVTIQPD